MKVLICGSRGWGDEQAVTSRLLRLPSTSTILVGDARGADEIANLAASLLRLPVEVFRADWEGHGKRAGIIRNLEMLDHAPDLVIAFWDGDSRGTSHTIGEARRRGIPVEVIQ